MAEESVSFALNLEGNAEQAAGSQAAALDRLKQSLQGDVAALRDMQAALRNLKGSSTVAGATVSDLKDRITAQRAKVASSQESILKLGGSFGAAGSKARQAGAGLKELGQAAGLAGGGIGRMGGMLGRLGPLLANPITAVAALAAGMIALAAVTANYASQLVRYGLAQADAARTELLRLEGLTKIRYFMGGLIQGTGRAAMSANSLRDAIDEVSDTTALGRDKAAGYVEQLYRMGLRGRNLKDALSGVAITAVTQGDAQAQMFAGWAAGANMTGHSVRALADDVKARLGGLAQKHLLSLTVIQEKLRENFARLFRDVHLEPVLRAFKSLADLFSQQTVTGRALKELIEDLFAPIGRAIEVVAPLVKKFFQGIIIGALEIENTILRLQIAFIKTFGKDTYKQISGFFDAFAGGPGGDIATKLGTAVFEAFAVTLGSMAVALGLAAANAMQLYNTLVKLKGVAVKLAEGADFSGQSIVKGIASGVAAGTPLLTGAMGTLAKLARRAFMSAIDAHSPSKLFKADALAGIGGGISSGVEASLPQVKASFGRLSAGIREHARAGGHASATGGAGASGNLLSNLRDTYGDALGDSEAAPRAPVAPRAAGGTSAQSPTLSINAPVTINVNGAQDPQAVARDVGAALESQLADLLANVVRRVGAAA